MSQRNYFEKTKEFWNQLAAHNLDILDDFYAEDALFQDPISTVHGLINLKSYFKKMYKNVITIEFVFDDHLESEDQLFTTWTMKLKAKGLKGGEQVHVQGCSLLKFTNNKVSYHRDYFDLGQFVYENVPLLSWIHQKVKKQLH